MTDGSIDGPGKKSEFQQGKVSHDNEEATGDVCPRLFSNTAPALVRVATKQGPPKVLVLAGQVIEPVPRKDGCQTGGISDRRVGDFLGIRHGERDRWECPHA